MNCDLYYGLTIYLGQHEMLKNIGKHWQTVIKQTWTQFELKNGTLK